MTFDLFLPLTVKELNRGNEIEAIAFYQNWVLRPLVEFLHIRDAQYQYNFNTRYIHYDLPKPVIDKLQPLFFICDVADLRAKRDRAVVWFWQIAEEFTYA